MKLYVYAVLLTAAGFAIGSTTNNQMPSRSVDNPSVAAKNTQRLSDDPPPALCPPLPASMCEHPKEK